MFSERSAGSAGPSMPSWRKAPAWAAQKTWMTRKLTTNERSRSPWSTRKAAGRSASTSLDTSTSGRTSSVIAMATTASVSVMVRSRLGPSPREASLLFDIPGNMAEPGVAPGVPGARSTRWLRSLHKLVELRRFDCGRCSGCRRYR